MHVLSLLLRGFFQRMPFILAGALVSVASAQTEVVWTFGAATAQATPDKSPQPDVTGSALVHGNNQGTTTLLATTSASNGYAGASGRFNAGVAARAGALNQVAPGGSAYFEFSLTPTAGKRLLTSAIRFAARSTSTGPQTYALFTSVDQFRAPLATGSLPNNSTWTLQRPSFSPLTTASGVPVVYRLYGYGGAGTPSVSTANWRIDDLVVTVATIAASGTAPAVTSTTPVDQAIGVSLSGPISVVFNQPVTVSAAAFSVAGSQSGSHTVTVGGGPLTYTLTPKPPFSLGETVTVKIVGAAVRTPASGARGMRSDHSFTFTTNTAPTLRAIHDVQGDGSSSPLVGQTVIVEGVVTASFQSTPDGLGGFYLQARESDHDANPRSSEGIFVFDHGSPKSISVTPGDVVSVGGRVVEFGTAPGTVTELTDVTFVTKKGTASLPPPVALTLPLASATALESYEGMLVRWPQTLSVTDNFGLGRFGEFSLSNGRLLQPTNHVAPGARAQAQAAANLLNRILVDDHSTRSYPDPTPFLRGSGGQGETLRAGDTVADLTGILSFRFDAYRIDPTEGLKITPANPRALQAPVVPGRLHIAISNVLNFFNGNGAGSGFPTPRGADTAAEFVRQRAKIVAGLQGLKADVIALTEVENDGYGSGSALRELVDSLNAASPVGQTYALIDASLVENGTDAIRVALIYRLETVAPLGPPAALANPYFNGVARPPLAQTFREIATREILTVCVNHFRAKASVANGAGATDGLSPNPNLDQNDGQGANNYVRTREAQTLAAWLATDPTRSGDPDVLIIGDLNAYAKEDPLTALTGAGYVNLTERFEGAQGYSYSFAGQFGRLDHALASPSLNRQVAGTATWHVNADEPVYFDYNLENKSTAQQSINVGTPYRYSDHDPVVIGLNLGNAR